jgi:hypothetical protein
MFFTRNLKEKITESIIINKSIIPNFKYPEKNNLQYMFYDFYTEEIIAYFKNCLTLNVIDLSCDEFRIYDENNQLMECENNECLLNELDETANNIEERGGGSKKRKNTRKYKCKTRRNNHK